MFARHTREVRRLFMERVSKENYYLDIAQTVAERATCLRRKFGAIIVKNDVIVSTGYNGSPRGRKNCTDLNFCYRDKLNIPAVSAMSFAARSMPSRMPLSPPLASRCWVLPCIWPVSLPQGS